MNNNGHIVDKATGGLSKMFASHPNAPMITLLIIVVLSITVMTSRIVDKIFEISSTHEKSYADLTDKVAKIVEKNNDAFHNFDKSINSLERTLEHIIKK